ncbi:bacterial transcriptional activator domain-containing protein [Paenarthrobacter sp. DKR-5]|uniref:AfsR/SARP family transcriptional regulator n=1 Tax=Paenarthrobacter sp. DKR-5 TaxID=2835535 RepID=UPI001BDDC279|nr:bacterial transcriptional activator domain-containing protein [Paenarthrobacter sp. DKR-5]MBT1002317.1 bacterial transcriptional activator domain-containing protein [Paenarthrobacter sp. DKR-5]
MDAILSPAWELSLLGFWQLTRTGVPVDVGARQQRLIAALALLGPRSRQFIAGLLWPDSPEAQAAGSLRTSLFRISHQLPLLLHCTPASLSLADGVRVDFREVRQLIASVQNGHAQPPEHSIDVLQAADLLPGWYEDWVMFEQERLQLLRLDALETMAARFLDAGDVPRAIEAARVAASIEPLRESAQQLLARSHLRAGNQAAAIRSFQQFRLRLQRELGVAPSRSFADLLNVPSSAAPAQ